VKRLRIVVLGYIVRGPLGGFAWHHLQYVMGLKELGHDVYFAEDSDNYETCYNPSDDTTTRDPGYGLRFAQAAFEYVGLGDRWAYYDAHTAQWLGPCRDRMAGISSSADIILNVSGVNPLRTWHEKVDARVLIDTDPAFTQIRHLTNDPARALAEAHNRYFSFGENVGLPYSGIPDDGFPWQPTRQPVVLSAWRTTPGPADGKFTTVMQWDSYPMREFKGQKYGLKSDSFSSYLDLPGRAGQLFELALGSRTAPKDLLRSKGWGVIDPREPSKSPWTYQRYIRHSKAEFTVAKHGYAVSRSGWFSERSAAYLASGRPVITQDTGFTDWLKASGGVLPFTSAEVAVEKIRDVLGNYEQHCRSAREVAEEYFDSRKVLRSLVDRAL
jgi:hypothetical protein